MGIHTPIDRHFRFGELYGIRRSYGDIVRSVEESKLENELFDMMMVQIVESGNLEKIERFAKKNERLRDFALENSISESICKMNESTNGLNIPRVVKKRASDRFRNAIENKALSIKVNSFKFPSFTKPIEEPTIYESEEDEVALYASQENESDNIDKLINNIAIKKGIVGGDEIVRSKNDIEFEKNLNGGINGTSEEQLKHNYSIRNVILESIAGNVKKTKLIPPTTLYTYGSNGDTKDYLNTTIKSVINGINAICGINFAEADYRWLASGRPTPFLKCEMVVNADSVKGNRLLNAYFGPAGEFKDYLYRADNTPKIEPSKAVAMSKIDREVNVVMSYPIVKVYATIISWDMVNGEERLREITAEDFRGTKIRVID